MKLGIYNLVHKKTPKKVGVRLLLYFLVTTMMFLFVMACGSFTPYQLVLVEFVCLCVDEVAVLHFSFCFTDWIIPSLDGCL